MTLDYYRIFYYVAQYQSFSKAAEILGNNQPNLSRCMNLLESELGCKLLVRTNRGVSLTPEGERLFSHVAIANEQLMLGEQEILKDKSLESGLVTIGASETALRLFLLNKLELFHHNYPQVQENKKIPKFRTQHMFSTECSPLLLLLKYTIHSYKKIYRIRSMYQTSDIEPDRYTTHPYIHHYP